MSTRILVVSARTAFAEALSVGLRASDLDYVGARRMDEALAVLGEDPMPAAVVVDLLTVAAGASDLCDAVRARDEGAQVPVIFGGTGKEEIKSTTDALLVGGDAYFQMPISVSKVVAKIATYIGCPVPDLPSSLELSDEVQTGELDISPGSEAAVVAARVRESQSQEAEAEAEAEAETDAEPKTSAEPVDAFEREGLQRADTRNDLRNEFNDVTAPSWPLSPNMGETTTSEKARPRAISMPPTLEPDPSRSGAGDAGDDPSTLQNIDPALLDPSRFDPANFLIDPSKIDPNKPRSFEGAPISDAPFSSTTDRAPVPESAMTFSDEVTDAMAAEAVQAALASAMTVERDAATAAGGLSQEDKTPPSGVSGPVPAATRPGAAAGAEAEAGAEAGAAQILDADQAPPTPARERMLAVTAPSGARVDDTASGLREDALFGDEEALRLAAAEKELAEHRSREGEAVVDATDAAIPADDAVGAGPAPPAEPIDAFLQEQSTRADEGTAKVARTPDTRELEDHTGEVLQSEEAAKRADLEAKAREEKEREENARKEREEKERAEREEKERVEREEREAREAKDRAEREEAIRREAERAAAEKARAEEAARKAAAEEERLAELARARAEAEEEARKAAEEASVRAQEEEEKLAELASRRAQAEEEAKRAADEAARRAFAEQERLADLATQRAAAEEEAARAAEEAAARALADEQKLAELAQRRAQAEEEARLAVEDAQRRGAQEEARVAELEQRRRSAEEEEVRTREEAAQRAAAERARIEEIERKRRDAEEEMARALEDAERRRHESAQEIERIEQQRKAAELEAQIQLAEAERRQAEEKARLDELERRRREAEADAARTAEEAARRSAEEQARLDELERRRQEAEADAARAFEEAARREAEERARLDDLQRQRAEAEERIAREAEEARRRAQEAADALAATERKEAEERAQLEILAMERERAEQDARRAVDDAKRREEELRVRLQELEAERQRASEEHTRAEEARRKRAEEERRRLFEIEQAREQLEEEARREAEARKKKEQEEEARLADVLAERQRVEGEVRRALEAKEQQLRIEEERLVAIQKARAEAEEQARRHSDEQTRLAEEAEARLLEARRERGRLEAEAAAELERLARVRAEEELARRELEERRARARLAFQTGRLDAVPTGRPASGSDVGSTLRPTTDHEGNVVGGPPLPVIPGVWGPEAEPPPPPPFAALEPPAGRFVEGELASLLWSCHHLRITGAVELDFDDRPSPVSLNPESLDANATVIPGERDMSRVRTIYFEEGEPILVVSQLPVDRPEEALLRAGLITTAKYNELRAGPLRSPRRCAAALAAEGALKNEELFPAVRGVLTEQIMSLLEHETGSFRYVEQHAHSADRVRLEHPFDALLAEGVRRKFDERRLWLVLGGPATLIGPDDRGRDLPPLSPEEKLALARLDGTRSVEDVIVETSLAPTVVLRTALIGVSCGAARLLARGVPGDPADRAAQRDRSLAIDRARILDRLHAARNGDYFAFLGVDLHASAFEVQRAAQRIRQRFDPMRYSDPAFADLKAALNEIVEVTFDAEAVLGDDALADGYRRNLLGQLAKPVKRRA